MDVASPKHVSKRDGTYILDASGVDIEIVYDVVLDVPEVIEWIPRSLDGAQCVLHAVRHIA